MKDMLQVLKMTFFIHIAFSHVALGYAHAFN